MSITDRPTKWSDGYLNSDLTVNDTSNGAYKGNLADDVVKKIMWGEGSIDDVNDDIHYQIFARHLDILDRLAEAEKLIAEKDRMHQLALSHIEAITALLK